MSNPLVLSYGFKSLAALKGYMEDHCIDTPEELAGAYESQYDTVMSSADAIALMAAVRDDIADEPEDLMTDAEADADVLAAAGMGTDEDYGCYGSGEE